MPAFTAKNYIAIAAAIHEIRANIRQKNLSPEDTNRDLEVVNQITLAHCKLFREDNPKFKEFQFIAACNRDLEKP